MRCCLGLLLGMAAWCGEMRVASFRADATPALGEPLIWVTPAARVTDPLWAKGIILDDGKQRYVICALDWCGVGGSTHKMLREKLAEAAGTDVSRVVLQSVHQHTAPYVVGDAKTPVRMSEEYLRDLGRRLQEAVRGAQFEMFDQVATCEVKVERVASARRIRTTDGKLVTRYSTSGKTPEMAALPEGHIDPMLRTVTLLNGTRPLVRLHYYATHPQTFCCEGTVTSDFVGAAREAVEREQGVFQIYFTGGAGDVTVGKYNDGSAEARAGLTQRMKDALRNASLRLKPVPAGRIRWAQIPLSLPAKQDAVLQASGSPEARSRAAITLAYAARKEPLEITVLEIGPATVVHLPGEPMVAFQEYARRLRPGRFVALAGYGDIFPGYLCTDRAYTEGGYEPGASNAAPGVEGRLKEALRRGLRH